jgi:hypothetical protein
MEMIMNIYSFVETMVGRQYPDVERELMADGFKKGKAVKDRSTGGAKVRFSMGTHEDATVIDVSHAWDIDHYGIGKPGKVTAGNIVDTGARYDNLRSF